MPRNTRQFLRFFLYSSIRRSFYFLIAIWGHQFLTATRPRWARNRYCDSAPLRCSAPMPEVGGSSCLRYYPPTRLDIAPANAAQRASIPPFRNQRNARLVRWMCRQQRASRETPWTVLSSKLTLPGESQGSGLRSGETWDFVTPHSSTAIPAPKPVTTTATPVSAKENFNRTNK